MLPPSHRVLTLIAKINGIRAKRSQMNLTLLNPEAPSQKYRLFPVASLFLLVALVLFVSGYAVADSGWTASTKDGRTMAKTPEQNWVLVMRKPADGLWGILYIKSNLEQIERLKKLRLADGFNFIKVILEIDDFQRELRARFDEKQDFIAVDVDIRAWEQLKIGNRALIRLPDGTTQEDSLRNSDKIMRQMEAELL
jgi:hypothetical protein